MIVNIAELQNLKFPRYEKKVAGEDFRIVQFTDGEKEVYIVRKGFFSTRDRYTKHKKDSCKAWKMNYLRKILSFSKRFLLNSQAQHRF